MEKIAKQKLNVILLIDCSKSMQGERISQVNDALRDIRKHLVDMQGENTNIDFYLSVITFSNDARFLNGDRAKAVDEFSFQDLKGGGWSNLHLAYEKLAEILQKEAKGGIMPDFGGVAPIILLLTDGHPTKYPLKEEMAALKKLPWFKVALKYGVAIELDDARTDKVLEDFVDGNGGVLKCFDAKVLEQMIKIIVLTASKVKSTATSVHTGTGQVVKIEVAQQVQKALEEVEEWEW